MSPLTKLFVVLLVITSMLNAAAIVVFVNKSRPVAKELSDMQERLASVQNQEQANLLAKQRAEDHYLDEANLRAKDQDAAAAAVANLQTQLNANTRDIATLTADKGQLQAEVTTADSAAALATSTVDTLQKQLTELRKSSDDLTKQNYDFNKRVADLTSTKETLDARLQDTQEQLAGSKDSVQKLRGFLADKGYDVDHILNTGMGFNLGGQAINGVVSDKSIINGNTYVTISVGSSDGVVKGMKFDVVNGPHFLGTVTIDTVDTNDAIGRVEGPAVGEVQKGLQVRTSTRGS